MIFNRCSFLIRLLRRKPKLSYSFSSYFGDFDVITTVGSVSSKKDVPSNIAKPEYWKSGLPAEPPKDPVIMTKDQIKLMEVSCNLAAHILNELSDFIKVGMTTDQVDVLVHDMCLAHGAYPSPLNYKNFPKSVCTSVNNVACHGIPDDRKLADGDIINVDVTVYKNGVHGDCSRMYHIGNVDSEGLRLSQVCLEALYAGISVCKPGQPFSVIGETIEHLAHENGLTVIPCFTGHGIGTFFHGPPDIYHIKYTYPGVMEKGMVFTIEPVLGQGSEEITILEDGWTALTCDSSRTAQWEHTVLVTDSGARPLSIL